MALGRAVRLVRLATEIRANPKTTPEALCQTLGISRSQFYKDKHALEQLGFEFRFSRRGRGFRVTRDIFLPAQDLTFPERFALVLAVRQLLDNRDYALGVDALSAIRKIIGQSPDAQRNLLLETLEDVALREGFGCKPAVLEALQEAMVKRWRVVLHHRSIRENQLKTWTVDPCALLFRRRALYLDGYALEAREYRMFRANRIEQVEVLPIQVPTREDYSFDRRHGSAFSVFPGEEPIPVQVRFDASVAPFVRETLWHPSQTIRDLPDGGIILEIEVAEPREVGWWALQWGADAEVLAPAGLRSTMAREAGRLHRRYEGAAGEKETWARAAEAEAPYQKSGTGVTGATEPPKP